MKNKNTPKISDLRTGTFFRFTIKKIIIDSALAVVILLIIFSLPMFQNLFSSQDVNLKIISIAINIAIFMLILYPIACLVIFLIFKKERQLNV
ncbi:Uncharacterised protein [uncultured archaeon]|nr:Uncharacterised protein [uncultured archaeon]